VPDDELIPTVERVAARIAEKSPLATRLMKQMVDQGLDMPLDRALRTEMEIWEGYGRSADVVEGLTAFSEKRKPAYTGR